MPTHVILDGLDDPRDAQWLSARWAAAGFVNAVDIGGQSAWLERDVQVAVNQAGSLSPQDAAGLGAGAEAMPTCRDVTPDATAPSRMEPRGDVLPAATAMTESDIARAAEMAREVGVEMRDRVGVGFVPANDLTAMREHMTREYRLRLAQSLVFGLPALAVHYLAPVLARGSGQSAGSLIYPWIFEMILVGWTLWTAGLPMLWQGGLALLRGKCTGDLLTAAIVLAAFAPSALGVVSFLWTSDPWLPQGPPPVLASVGATQASTQAASAPGPQFHIALMAVMLAVAQRWLLWRRIERLAGRGNLMLPRFGRLVAAWLISTITIMALIDATAGLSFALLLPPMLALGGINRRNPGLLIALPVLVFAPIFVLGPGRFDFAPGAEHVRFEIAAGFALMMTVVMAWGWGKQEPRGGSGERRAESR